MPVEFADLLNNTESWVFYNRVVCYLDYTIAQKNVDYQSIINEIEQYINIIYWQNTDMQQEMLKRITDIVKESNRKSKLRKMFILGKITCFQLVIISKLKNRPTPWAQILKIWKGFPQKIHSQSLKLFSKSLTRNLIYLQTYPCDFS